MSLAPFLVIGLLTDFWFLLQQLTFHMFLAIDSTHYRPSVFKSQNIYIAQNLTYDSFCLPMFPKSDII